MNIKIQDSNMKKEKLYIILTRINVCDSTNQDNIQKLVGKDFSIKSQIRRFSYIGRDEKDNYYMVFPENVFSLEYGGSNILTVVPKTGTKIRPDIVQSYMPWPVPIWTHGYNKLRIFNIPSKVAATILLNYTGEDLQGVI